MATACPKCGLPQEDYQTCEVCKKRRPRYVQARAFAYYLGDFRQALLHLKSHRDIALGMTFAEYLAGFFAEMDWSVDIVAPVPLSKIRFNERGYNQVELFCRPFAILHDIAYEPRAVEKMGNAKPQMGLDLEARWQNVENSFQAVEDLVKSKTVLVLDDVMTTGATLKAASEALLNGGAKKVCALTLARAVIDDPHP